MNAEGTPKDDVKVPEGDLGTQISAGFDEGKDLLVTIISAMGEEQVSLARSHQLPCALINFGRLFRLRKPRKALNHLRTLMLSLFPVFPSCICILRPFILRPYGCHSVVHVLFIA
jgi:hypothetical protein